MEILKQIQSAKSNEKHLLIITVLIDNDIQFIEDSELIYKLFYAGVSHYTFFARTGMIQGKGKATKLKSFAELLQIVKA